MNPHFIFHVFEYDDQYDLEDVPPLYEFLYTMPDVVSVLDAVKKKHHKIRWPIMIVEPYMEESE